MISKRIAESFALRERDDFRACLKWQEQDIEAALAKLPVRPPLWEPLRRSQRICVVIGAHLHRFGFYSDMGTGKSLVAMALADYYREAKGAKHWLVLVPNRVNVSGWLDQIKKHAPHLTAKGMPSSIAGKLALVAADKRPLLTIETYAGFTRLCSRKGGTNGGKQRLTTNMEMLVHMAADFDGMIIDESSAVGHHDSLQTRVVTALAQLKPEMPVFMLSGTPFGRDPHLLWSQMKVIDEGWTLGETLSLFRGTFFTTSTNNWGGYEHKFKPKETPKLHRYIAHRSIRFPLDEADLPDLTNVLVELEMPHDATQYYQAALAQLRKAKGSYQLMKNAFVRMRQISSGFINVRDEDTGVVERLVLKDNPKLEWVKSQLGEIDPEHKVVVFHDFLYSGEVLKRELEKMGVRSALINGQVGKTAVEQAYESFTKGNTQVLLLNSQAGAYGLNLQMARFGIYYESPVPVIIRKQTMLRFHRPGSLHKSVVCYDLVTKDTVDATILEFHKNGKDLFAGILDGSVRL